MPTEAYRTSQTKFYFGGVGFLADLTGSLNGSFVLGGRVTVDKLRVTDTGRTGLTADGVAAGFTATMDVRYTPEVRKLLTNRVGILFIAMNDERRCYAVPAVVSGLPLTAAADTAITLALAFTQHAAGNAIEGAMHDTAGQVVVGAGHEGYSVRADSIARHTGSFTLTNTDSYGVQGLPLIGEAAV